MEDQERRDVSPMTVLTGAGISAESGIPTFRGQEGLWEEYRAQDLATPAAFNHDPALVWRFYAWRREIIARNRPNRAHHVLAEMEHTLEEFQIITQNVDGMHQAAGSQRVLELHGSLWRMRCTSCDLRWEDHRVPLPNPIPHCPKCESLARPDVVWFGEALDSVTLQCAFDCAAQSLLTLVIGTSAIVRPAADIPGFALASGARLVEINIERTPISDLVDEFIQGPASTVLARWWQKIRPID